LLDRRLSIKILNFFWSTRLAGCPCLANPSDSHAAFVLFAGDQIGTLIKLESGSCALLLLSTPEEPAATIAEDSAETDGYEPADQFPSDQDVIITEVARFRALSPEKRMQFIRDLLAAGALMMRRSPKAAFLRGYTLEQENSARQAIKEFIARHAR
jgi:hypothetical protein